MTIPLGHARDTILAFPHNGTVKAEFMLSVFDACQAPDSRIAELRDFRTGPAMAQARNEMTKLFLNGTCEWLWMVDADMVVSARTLPRLRASADPVRRPVVGALTFIQMGPAVGEQAPNMFQAVRDEAGEFAFKSMERFPLGEPVQVAATGGACLLIHRDVFELISEKAPEDDGLWWADIRKGKTLFGEDFSFCMRCAQHGIPVYVDTGCQVSHTKSIVIGQVTP